MDSYNTEWRRWSDMNSVRISYNFIKCAKHYCMDIMCGKSLNDCGEDQDGVYLWEARGRGMGSERYT